MKAVISGSLDESVKLADIVGTLPSKPRTANAQANHSNTPSDTASEYYHRVISIPFF